MRLLRNSILVGAALFLTVPSTSAQAHWCDDIWSSAYNIVVRPDSDTSPKALYVENHMGYQLPNFKLTATAASGGAITLTAPTTLKVANTLLPGERGTWKIASGNPAKIEDINFALTFGNTTGQWTSQYRCYPVADAKAVMVVKTDGSLYPATPTGIDNPKSPSTGCAGGMGVGRSLQYAAITDFEDLNVGLDKLLQLYCAGRGSWGTGDAVSPTYCKDTKSTTCPTSKPSSVGSVADYMHLWSAGELAIRKGSLGDRLPVFRERLKCGVNDGDMGFAGYSLFILGYLGDDAGAKSFLQTKASAGGDLGTIAKAALYLTGDTAQKADVQAGVQSSSVFVKVACAAALGIADKDDASVTSAIFPQVKWNEPDVASEDGNAMYAAHMLEIVAFARRGWVFKGVGGGSVTFYGETGGGAGGNSAPGGAGGNSAPGGAGGNSAPGGAGGNSAPGGTPGAGGRVGSGGSSGAGGTSGTGGAVGSGGKSGSAGATTNRVGDGGVSGHGGGNGGMTSGGEQGEGNGCKCSLGGRPNLSPIWFLALAGLGLLLVRSRRQ